MNEKLSPEAAETLGITQEEYSEVMALGKVLLAKDPAIWDVTSEAFTKKINAELKKWVKRNDASHKS